MRQNRLFFLFMAFLLSVQNFVSGQNGQPSPEENPLSLDITMIILRDARTQILVSGTAKLPTGSVVRVTCWEKEWVLSGRMDESIRARFARPPAMVHSTRVPVAANSYGNTFTISPPESARVYYSVEVFLDVDDQPTMLTQKAVRPGVPVKSVRTFFIGCSPDVPRRMKDRLPEHLSLLAGVRSMLDELKSTLGADKNVPQQVETQRAELMEKGGSLSETNAMPVTISAFQELLSKMAVRDPNVSSVPARPAGQSPWKKEPSGQDPEKSSEPSGPMTREQMKIEPTRQSGTIILPAGPLLISPADLKKELDGLSQTLVAECFLTVRYELCRLAGILTVLRPSLKKSDRNAVRSLLERDVPAGLRALHDLHRTVIDRKEMKGYRQFWVDEDPEKILQDIEEYSGLLNKESTGSSSEADRKRLDELTSVLEKLLK